MLPQDHSTHQEPPSFNAGNRLKDILADRRISVAQLSKSTGITTSSIYSMLGNDDIKLQTLLKFLEELDVSLHAFVYGDEPEQTDFDLLQAKYEGACREIVAMRDHIETLKLSLQRSTIRA